MRTPRACRECGWATTAQEVSKQAVRCRVLINALTGKAGPPHAEARIAVAYVEVESGSRKVRPGRLRVEEILLVRCHVLRSDFATHLGDLKIPLPAVDRHEIGHQLPCHGQHGAVGITLPFFLVVEHGQLRTVARGHLGRLDQGGL